MPSAFGSLLKSTVVLGGAQLVQIGLSLLRMKVVALLVGPTGVGLLGVYGSLQGTAVTAAGLGIASSGVRQIAATGEDSELLRRIRSVLLLAHILQGAVALTALMIFSGSVSTWLLGSSAFAFEVCIVGLAVLLGLIASAQTAILQGMQRAGDLARVGMLSGVIMTVAGTLIVYFFNSAGLIWFILLQPLSTAGAAWVALLRRGISFEAVSAREFTRQWRPMVSLGLVFMVGSLVSGVTMLFLRSLIIQTDGLSAAGHFSASWSISVQYMSLLLGAMAAGYYPKLVSAAGDSGTMTDLVNDQTQIGLALGGPGLLLLIGCAPWVVQLLYSSDFAPAAELLQWQVIGNVCKIVSWPLAYVLVAASHGRVFLILEIGWNAVFFGLVYFGLPMLGLRATGVAFLVAYIVYLIATILIVRRLYRINWSAASFRLGSAYALLSGATFILALSAPVYGTIASICGAAIMCAVGVWIIARSAPDDLRTLSRLLSRRGVP